MFVPLDSDRQLSKALCAVSWTRHAQGYTQSAFLVQRGRLGALVGGRVGAQVIVPGNVTTRGNAVYTFTDEIEGIAEVLVQKLGQEITCEVKKFNKIVDRFRVGADGAYTIAWYEEATPPPALVPGTDATPRKQAGHHCTRSDKSAQGAHPHLGATPAPPPRAPYNSQLSYNCAPTCVNAVLALVPVDTTICASDILLKLDGVKNREGKAVSIQSVQLALRHLHNRQEIEQVGRKEIEQVGRNWRRIWQRTYRRTPVNKLPPECSVAHEESLPMYPSPSLVEAAHRAVSQAMLSLVEIADRIVQDVDDNADLMPAGYPTWWFLDATVEHRSVLLMQGEVLRLMSTYDIGLLDRFSACIKTLEDANTRDSVDGGILSLMTNIDHVRAAQTAMREVCIAWAEDARA